VSKINSIMAALADYQDTDVLGTADVRHVFGVQPGQGLSLPVADSPNGWTKRRLVEWLRAPQTAPAGKILGVSIR
jgi:hypothetical protein